MHQEIALIYNEPSPGRYGSLGEEKAVLGIIEAVEAVHQALIELGYAVTLTPLSPPLKLAEKALKSLKVDLIFNLFEGFTDSPKTEAKVAGMLAALRLPYTGCSAAVLALGLDKARTKALLAANGISTPRYQLLNPKTLSAFQLSYPCIVKPQGEDASHGVSEESVVHNSAALAKQVVRISQLFGGQALVEEFVDGREFNITVLGTKQLAVLPISEIVFSLPPGLPRILTFAAKWESQSPYFEGTRAVCPAEIGNKLQKEIGNIAKRTFRLLDGSGYARVDFRMNNNGQLQVIEVNPNPDISPGTGAARQAHAAGMTYSQFMAKLIQLALERESDETQDTPNDSRGQTGNNADTESYTRI